MYHALPLTSRLTATLDDYEKGVDVSVIRDKYTEASAKGDTDRIVVWAGTGVGLIKHKLPAKVRIYHSVQTL